MNHALALIPALLAGASLASAADSPLLELMMPDAKVVFGANISRIAASTLGKSLEKGLRGQAPGALAGLIAATGFDPTRDLQEILIASNGGTGATKNPPAIVLLRGSFDAGRLGSYATANGSQAATYQGVQIYEAVGKSLGAFAVLDGSLAIAGPVEQVRAAIHRRGRGAGIRGDLIRKIAGLSSEYDIWIVSVTPASELASQMGAAASNPNAELIKSIQQFSGGVKLSAGLEVSAEILSRTERDAQRLGDALQLLVTAAQQQNQQAACPECLKVRVVDATVQVSLNVPEEMLRKAMEARMNSRVAGRTPAPPPSTDLVIQSSPSDMGTVKVSPGR